MTTKNDKNGSKENDKNKLNTGRSSINPEEELHKKRPKSAKYEDVSSVKSMFYSTFQQHPEECLCKQCICGRHLCKFNAPTPGLSFSTTYRRHYPPRNPSRYHNASSNRPLSATLIESPLLTFSSTYMDNFHEVNGDGLQRPKPNDLLKCKEGPSQDLTVYKNQYPGHKGKNQYVPMNPEPSRGGLGFNASTTYSKQYKRPAGKSASNAKPADQFSMTGSWLGGSSYRDQYQNPKNHLNSKKRDESNISAFSNNDSKNADISPQKNASSHFSTYSFNLETTYKNDYIKNSSTICPAAKTLLDQSTLEKSRFK